MITELQSKRLMLKPYAKWSPLLENCCLLLSANESYERAAEDVQILTGRAVSKSSQQRMVHRQDFTSLELNTPVEEMSLDGGKVRLRTPKGEPSQWRDYKAITLHDHGVQAFFQDNDGLVAWANDCPKADPVICLGDGHDGIWNIFAKIGEASQRREILDWYHLIENLGKVGGSPKRLLAAQALLWQGKVEETITIFESSRLISARKFCNYLAKHRSRIVNYEYYQAEGISIGSGAVESMIKQIGSRIKISGAQWSPENVSQVLKHRTAYLNGCLSS